MVMTGHLLGFLGQISPHLVVSHEFPLVLLHLIVRITQRILVVIDVNEGQQMKTQTLRSAISLASDRPSTLSKVVLCGAYRHLLQT